MFSLAIALLAQAPSKMGILQCAFFIAPDSIPAVTPNLMKSYTERHLAGLEDLWEKGIVVAAGPFENAGNYRGVAFFNVQTPEEVKQLLQFDPYVRNGIRRLEVLPWFCENRFVKAKSFRDYEPLWFGILERPVNAPKYDKETMTKIQEGHMANINRMAKDGLLASAGPFNANESRRGIFIFTEQDKLRIEKAVSMDTAIQKKRLELRLMKWKTGRGTLPPYTSE